MYLTPISIKTYRSKKSKAEFLKEMRENSREPFFDNKNSRRLDKDEKKMFASEFDNFIILKCEIMGYHWYTNKTLIHLSENDLGLRVFTISFPSGLVGFLYFVVGLGVSLFFGIKIFLSEGNINPFLLFVLLYVLVVSNVISDFRVQNNFVKSIIDKLNSYENKK